MQSVNLLNCSIVCSMLLSLFFYVSIQNTKQLLALFLLTFSSSLTLYSMMVEPWNLNLLLIVMVTGLFLVFTYITSVTPEIPTESNNKTWSLFFFVFMFLVCSLPWNNYNSFFFFSTSKLNFYLLESSVFISTMLVILLLTLVICFIRLTYNKGGSLRKKY